MTEREAFIESIAANPHDDTPRLAFADWLQERNENERAEFIRIQCEIARRPCGRNYSSSGDYDSVPSNPDPMDPRRAHAVGLLLDHWPEWFGGILTVLGMPEPTPTTRPEEPWGEWRYGPYALRERDVLPNVLILFADRYAGLYDPGAWEPATEYLGNLLLDRGFVTGLSASLEFRPVECSLAAALRLEPIDSLLLGLDPDPTHWVALSHPLLRRIRDLKLSLWSEAVPEADYFYVLAMILNDPNLTGVRSLSFLGVAGSDQNSPPRLATVAEVGAFMGSALARSIESLTLYVGSDGVRVFAEADALPALDKLQLSSVRLTAEEVLAVALPQYRDQLRELNLYDHDADCGLLSVGRPWRRLASLTLGRLAPGGRECESLAQPNMFPTLSRLRFTNVPGNEIDALAEAVRLGRFPHLTALEVSGRLDDASLYSVIALARAVVPTAIRELDVRGVWPLTLKVHHEIRELLGTRVRLNEPPDPNDPTPF